jgi:predicted house-cleaning noncanonical NTP pyrophosphatase (MazG superfamily)
MLTRLSEFKLLLEKSKKTKGDLVVVDVQEEFKKFFNDKYVEELQKYCEKFDRVFQIWDCTKAKKPSIDIPNEAMRFKKKYGGKPDIDNIELIFRADVLEDFLGKYHETNPSYSIGEMFRTVYGDYWVYIGSKHEWFNCPKDMAEQFKKMAEMERPVTIVGGGVSECLEDVFTTMWHFGVPVEYDRKYVYGSNGCMF